MATRTAVAAGELDDVPTIGDRIRHATRLAEVLAVCYLLSTHAATLRG